MRVSAIQTPRLTESAYDSGGSAEMESFIRGMVTQMRTDYIETSEDEDQVLEEADPEQEYDEEIAQQGYDQEVDEEDTARLE